MQKNNIMNTIKIPCWKFWKIPVEPIEPIEVDGYAVAVLKLGLFKANYELSEYGRNWLSQRIVKEDYETIINFVQQKVFTLKCAIDSLRALCAVLFVISILAGTILLVQEELLIGSFLVVTTLTSLLILKIIGYIFIKLLEKLEKSISEQFRGINEWLLSKNRQIIVGDLCFYIKFEIDDTKILLMSSNNADSSQWLGMQKLF